MKWPSNGAALLGRRGRSAPVLVQQTLHLRATHFSSVATPDNGNEGLRVGVVGLGAIGTIFFTQLSLVARQASPSHRLVRSVDAFVKPHHFSQLKQQRAVLLSRPHEEGSPFATVTFDERDGKLVSADGAVRIQTLDSDRHELPAAPLDIVLVALKAHDGARIIEELRTTHAHRLRRDAVVVLLQNGLGALPSQEASTTSGSSTKGAPATAHHYVNGVTYVGGRALSMGHVVVSGFATEPTCFAPVKSMASGRATQTDAADDRLRMLSDALVNAGLRSQVLTTNEMQTILWRKLVVNAAINPIAAVLDASNGSVGACEWSRRTVEAVVHEVVAIAEREQVDLQATEQEMVEYVLRVAVNTRTNVCSTLADLRKGARTEIDAITGQIVQHGEKHDVPTPTNALLYDLVKALETQQLRVERNRA